MAEQRAARHAGTNLVIDAVNRFVRHPAPAAAPGPGTDLPVLPPTSAGRRRGRISSSLSHVADHLQHVSGAVAAVERGARTVCTPEGLTGVAIETVWNAAHLAVYPLGLLAERRREHHAYGTHHLSPTQRGLLIGDVEAAGTPILLLHGMIDNRSVFTALRAGLQRRGFARVMTLNYSPFTNDVREAARVLADRVEQLCLETGYERIHIVGHSLGGLIARYYVQRLAGHHRVHTLVTLGSPHQGTIVAKLWNGPLTRQLRPESEVIAELNEPAPHCDTAIVCYWSDLDHVILPSRNGRIAHPDLAVKNVLVRGVGHMSLPIQPRLIHDIANTLRQLDTHGHIRGGAQQTTHANREESA